MEKDKNLLARFNEPIDIKEFSEVKEDVNLFEDALTPEEIIAKPEVKDEEVLPFHKDPKVKRYIEKELDKRITALQERPIVPQEVITKSDEFKDVIDSFTAIIGNDSPEKVNALNSLQKALAGLDERAVKKAEDKILEIRNREIEAEKRAEKELEDAFDAIEDTFSVDLRSNSKVRKDFLSFAEKIAPKDREGNIIDYPDMLSAWETYESIKRNVPSRAKELASRSMTRPTGSEVPAQKGVGWSAVDEYLESLQN